MYLLAFIIFHVFSLLLEMTKGTQAVGSSSRYVCVCGVDQDLMERLGGMEVRKKIRGRGQRRLVLDSAAPPPFFLCKCLSFFFVKFLVMTFSWVFFSNRPPSLFYTLRSVFIVQESHHLREVKSQLNSFSFLKFELEFNSKANNYQYLEGKDYLEDKDRMAKAHCSP
jgi:hypothetical protein